MRLYGIVLIVLLVALARPDLLTGLAARLRAALEPLTRRPWLAGSLAVLLPLLLRVALLSRWPIPEPKILDEFSYLYAADTFASGHLANPPHPHWRFFETVYVLSQPVGASKYPPAQGLMLALGQVTFGDPWYGVWLSCGLMTAAFYWLLLARLPSLWAWLGALWFGVYTGLLTDWMNSYWGGAVAATAGAVMLGSFLRFSKRSSAGLGAVFAAAWVVLANSRPYEGGLLFGLPLTLLFLGKHRPGRQALIAGAATLALGTGLSMFYHHAVTGHPLKLPYALHDQQYAYAGPFWLQPLRPKPAYRQPVIENAFRLDELRYQELREWKGWQRRGVQWRHTIEFFGPWPVVVLPALVALWWLRRRQRYRTLLILLLLGGAGLNLTVFHFAHYAAPFAGLLVLIIVQGWRLLAQGIPNRHTPALLAALAVYAGLTTAQALRASVQPPASRYLTHFRHVMERHLEQDFDQHLIFVTHPRALKEVDPTWIYNKAHVDEAKTVWAADFGDGENQTLLRYYPARTAWQLDVDDRTLTLRPYRAKPGQQPLQFIEAGRQFEERKPTP